MTPSDVAYSFQRNMLQGGTSSPQWLLTEPILGAGIADITDIITPTLAGPDVETLNDDPENLALVPADVLLATCQKVVDAFVADDAAGTVTVKLAQPWGPFLATLANTWGSVSSKAWVISKGGWDGDCATWQNYYGKSSEQVNELGLGTEAMGTGPFMLDHWTQGEEYVLKANESYWRTEPAWEGGPTGAPALKTVIVKSVDEFSTRFAMLQAGDADAIQVGAASDWPQMDTLVGESCEGKLAENCQPEAENPEGSITRIKGLQQTARTDIFFTFNINAEGNTFIGSGVVDGNGIPPDFFSDIHIRKAFAYCFNYEAYFNDVMLGEAVRSKNVIIPGMLGYDDASPFYEQDLAKCEEEFKASTWTAADGTSLWDTGFRMTIGYNTGNTARQTAAQIFQTEIGAINENFIVEFTGLPWPTFLRNQRASNLPIFISGWQEDIHDPHNWVQPYTTGTYGGRQALPAEIKAQFADINTRAVTESDPAKRDAIYKTEFNPLIYETVSVIPMYVSLTRRYQQRWVKGWYYNDIFPGTYYYPISKQ
jgi:peptide/nickel transport system substrate-binding protein